MVPLSQILNILTCNFQQSEKKSMEYIPQKVVRIRSLRPNPECGCIFQYHNVAIIINAYFVNFY